MWITGSMMGTHRCPAEWRLPTKACAGTTGYVASPLTTLNPNLALTCTDLAQCRVAPAHLHVAAVELFGEREHLIVVGVLGVLHEGLPAYIERTSAFLSMQVAACMH